MQTTNFAKSVVKFMSLGEDLRALERLRVWRYLLKGAVLIIAFCLVNRIIFFFHTPHTHHPDVYYNPYTILLNLAMVIGVVWYMKYFYHHKLKGRIDGLTGVIIITSSTFVVISFLSIGNDYLIDMVIRADHLVATSINVASCFLSVGIIVYVFVQPTIQELSNTSGLPITNIVAVLLVMTAGSVATMTLISVVPGFVALGCLWFVWRKGLVAVIPKSYRAQLGQM